MNISFFIQAFLNRLSPLFHEVALTAVRHFHPDVYPLGAVVAAAGALLASAMLYAIGCWLRRVPRKISTAAQQLRVAKMQSVAREWLPWLLILAPTPIGAVLLLAAGFFGVRLWVAAAMVLTAEMVWRVAPVM